MILQIYVMFNIGDLTGHRAFNSLPNDKILDLSKFKAFADNKW